MCKLKCECKWISFIVDSLYTITYMDMNDASVLIGKNMYIYFIRIYNNKYVTL